MSSGESPDYGAGRGVTRPSPADLDAVLWPGRQGLTHVVVPMRAAGWSAPHKPPALPADQTGAEDRQPEPPGGEQPGADSEQPETEPPDGEPPDSEARPGRRRPLRPEDYLPTCAEPPELGWQRLAFQLGARRVKPGRRELRHRTWHQLTRQTLSSPKIIAVFSPKGGVGKSTTTIGLGQVLARVRGDLIVALDANPDSGNLVKRIREPYSVFSADDLDRDAGQLSHYSDLLPYVTQDDSGLCVVRSSGDTADRLGPEGYHNILDLLSKFYSIIIADLGTGMREPAFLSIVEAADALVAVTQPTFDAAEVAIEGIDWLGRRFPGKIGPGTLVLNAVEPRYTRLDVHRLAAELGKHMVRVLQVPRDPHLALGGVPQWPLLARRTQDAYLELAATVIDGLRKDDSRESSPAGRRGTAASGRARDEPALRSRPARGVTRRTVLLGLGGASAATLAATGWQLSRRRASRLPTSGRAARKIRPGARIWVFQTGGGVGSPAVADGVVYAGSGDRTVYALRASDGRKVWSHPTSSPAYFPPAVAEGVVYIGSSDGTLYALRASDGAPLWHRAVGIFAEFKPAVADGRIYAGSSDGSLYALRASDGNKIWRFPTYWTDSRLRGVTSPAVADGVVYIGTVYGNVGALRAGDARKIWADTLDGFVTAPAVAGGVLYVGCANDNVYALRASDGSRVWNHGVSGYVTGGPTVADGVVYAGSDDHNIYALGATDGALLWSYRTGDYVGGGPTVADGVVYAGSGDHNLYALRASDGTELWSYTTGNSVLSQPAVDNGAVYVGSNDGKLYALQG